MGKEKQKVQTEEFNLFGRNCPAFAYKPEYFRYIIFKLDF